MYIGSFETQLTCSSGCRTDVIIL